MRVFNNLLELDDLKGFKNSWHNLCDITQMIAQRDRLRPDVSMLTGLDACLYATRAMGGDGLFTAITYLLPDVMKTIYDMGENSFSLQCNLLKLIDMVNKFSFPYGYRVLAEACGFPLGKSREVIPQSIEVLAGKLIPEMKNLAKELTK